MATQLSAQNGEIKQVVSYLTLKNLSLDTNSGGINPNDFRFYDKNGNMLRANDVLGGPKLATIDWNSTAIPIEADAGWGAEFMLLWLLLLLLVPILVAIMCCCLSRKEKNDTMLASLMEKDWEAGKYGYEQGQASPVDDVFGKSATSGMVDEGK